MNWPKGKHNGRLIEGVHISMSLHLLTWFWRPRCSWNFGEPYLIWLCLSLRAKTEYF